MARFQSSLPHELDIRNGIVSAKIPIPRGARFGPFEGKWTNEPVDQRYAWEVSNFNFFFLLFLK